jgi:hypothetical protein
MTTMTLAEQMADMTHVSGESLRNFLEEAMRTRNEALVVEEYGKYEIRATGYMVKREAMPKHELSDPCCFQCRACGWNPYDATVHSWFWALSLVYRRELVSLSRKIRVSFYRGKVEE